MNQLRRLIGYAGHISFRIDEDQRPRSPGITIPGLHLWFIEGYPTVAIMGLMAHTYKATHCEHGHGEKTWPVGAKWRWGAGLVLLVLVTVLGCVSQPRLAPVSRQDVRTFNQIVTELADPSMEGRGAGTAGLDRARDYLVRWLRDVGLEPVFALDQPVSGRATPGQASKALSESSDGVFTQSFDVNLTPEVTAQTLELLDSQGELTRTARSGVDFSVLGFSAGGRFVGSAVFVGYGIIDEDHRYNSYDGSSTNELLGKVAVAFRYEPHDESGKSLWAGGEGDLFTSTGRWTGAAGLVNKAKWAAQRGAVALLIVDPPTLDEHNLKSTRGSATGEEAAIPVLHISGTLFNQMLRAAGNTSLPWKVRQWLHDANRGADRCDTAQRARGAGPSRDRASQGHDR